MGGWEVWFALIVAAAVWILGHLLRQSAQNEERRDQARPGPGERRAPGRPPGGAPRQPPARSELDRFLQEVNRRKQLAEQQERAQQGSAAPPERRPVRPRTVTIDRPPPRRVAEPIPEVIPVEPARSRPAVARRAEPAPVLELAQAEALPATVLPVTPAASVAGQVTLGTATAFPPTRRKAGSSGALRQLGTMLRSTDNLRAGLMLREILDRPLCQRRRGR